MMPPPKNSFPVEGAMLLQVVEFLRVQLITHALECVWLVRETRSVYRVWQFTGGSDGLGSLGFRALCSSQ